MVEIYTDQIDVSNPGQLIVSVERYIDEYNSRNELSVASIYRQNRDNMYNKEVQKVRKTLGNK